MKSFNQFLSEQKQIDEKYEVEVSVRDARKAHDIAQDMFRGTYNNKGSNVYIFKKEDDYDDFVATLEKHKIEILEEQLDEATALTAKQLKTGKTYTLEAEDGTKFKAVVTKVTKTSSGYDVDYEYTDDKYSKKGKKDSFEVKADEQVFFESVQIDESRKFIGGDILKVSNGKDSLYIDRKNGKLEFSINMKQVAIFADAADIKAIKDHIAKV